LLMTELCSKKIALCDHKAIQKERIKKYI